MSAASRELRRREERARARFAAGLERLGEDAEELARCSARRHPWAFMATGGLAGFLFAFCSSAHQRDGRDGGSPRRRPLRSAFRLAQLWAIRRIASPDGQPGRASATGSPQSPEPQ